MKNANNQLVIVIENAKKSFGGNEVVKDISFHLNKRRKFSNLGKSGTGKSVLIKCIDSTLQTDSVNIGIWSRYKFRRKRKIRFHQKKLDFFSKWYYMIL
jgi:ABC-type polar amino acid transport system ATPase subunit